MRESNVQQKENWLCKVSLWVIAQVSNEKTVDNEICATDFKSLNPSAQQYLQELLHIKHYNITRDPWSSNDKSSFQSLGRTRGLNHDLSARPHESYDWTISP